MLTVLQAINPEAVAAAVSTFTTGGTVSQFFAEISQDITQTASGVFTRIGGVALSLEIGLLDTEVATGVKALYTAWKTGQAPVTGNGTGALERAMADDNFVPQAPAQPQSQNGTQSNFNTNESHGGNTLLDPVASYAYIYKDGSNGTEFSSVTLPDIIGSNTNYEIYTMQNGKWTPYSSAQALGEVTFASPVSTFLVTGADVSGLPSGTDFVSAVSFSTSGTFNGSITTLTQSAVQALNLPSPSGLLSALTLGQQTELIYLGYFNRAADAGGFNFWEGQDATAQSGGQSASLAMTNIANSFTPQAETIALYPFLSNPNANYSDPTVQAGLATLVGNVYENLFDRAADSGGLAYWTGQIESGAVGLGAAVLDIANGAQGADAVLLQNKITVALDLTTLAAAANLPASAAFLTESHAILIGVTSDVATITPAENTINALVAGTASVITGTVNNETLAGGSHGYDILFPAGGADTINLSSASHAIETIYFGTTVSASGTAVVPITNASGVTQQGFWGNASAASGLSANTSSDMSVVHNFTAGAAGDVVGFNVTAWGSGGTVNVSGMELGLVQGDAATSVVVGGAALGSVAAAGATLAANANVVVDSVAIYANAAALASALSNSSGHLTFSGLGLWVGDDAHLLVAYSTGSSVNIADVKFDNTTSAAQADTANLTVTASDMAQLVGVSLAALTAHNLALVA